MLERMAAGILSIFIGFAGAVLVQGTNAGEENIQRGIAKEILRFHVIANSDAEEDQALKLEVKDYIVTYMQKILKDCETIDETREIVKEHLEDIRLEAEGVIMHAGYDYTVSVSLEECYFPIKTYGACTFPAGIYEALRIEIGKAEGKNWWCVMYPNLCFIDAVHAVVEDEELELLHNVLTEEEYYSILNLPREKLKIKSKLLEWILE